MEEIKLVHISDFEVGGARPVSFILGPCVIESEDSCRRLAHKIKVLSEELDFKFVFKSSYDKANRTSVDSYRGIGIDKGLEVLGSIKKDLEIPVITDAHSINEIERAAEVADVVQVPAFLCRQTDLLLAAADQRYYVNFPDLQGLSWMLRLQSESPVSGLEFIKYPSIISTEKIKREIGYQFSYSSREALLSFLEHEVP